MLSGSIVIFNERIEILTKAVNSFLEGTTDSVLYLIDNSPIDKVSHLFNHPRVVYKFNNKNIGFGRGHNIAIRESMMSGSEYHLVLNPDVYFDNTVIDDLLLFLNQNKDVGLIIPKVRYPDGRIQLVCRLLPDPWILLAKRLSPFYGSFLTKKNKSIETVFSEHTKAIDAPFLLGCFMLLRMDALRQVGLFDEDIFLYMEDTDLCRRIHSGYRTVFYPHKTIFHYHQRGSTKRLDLFFHHSLSAIKYFNKWGWLRDPERRGINKRILNKFQRESGYAFE